MPTNQSYALIKKNMKKSGGLFYFPDEGILCLCMGALTATEENTLGIIIQFRVGLRYLKELVGADEEEVYTFNVPPGSHDLEKQRILWAPTLRVPQKAKEIKGQMEKWFGLNR